MGEFLEVFVWKQAYLLSEDNQKFSLNDRRTTIGRSFLDRDVDIDLAEMDTPMLVSRKHASIKHNHNQYSIKDDESRNGVFVNSLKIPSGEYQLLNEGDLIQFGGTQGVGLRFHYQPVK